MKRRSTHLALLAIAGFTVASRVLFLTSSTNMWDSCDYLGDVRKLFAEGIPLIYTSVETGHPLYVQLCAIVTWLIDAFGGDHDVLTAMKLTGVFATALSIWPFFWLARWLLRHDGWALASTCFFVLVPLGWWWSGEIMSDAAGLAVLITAFGLLARGVERKSSRFLYWSCLAMGTCALVRVAALGFGPLFGGIFLWSVIERRAWRDLRALALIPLPVIAYVIWAERLMPHRDLVDWFARSSQNVVYPEQVFNPARWREIYDVFMGGLGPVGAVGLALGWCIAWFRRWRLALFATVWLVLLGMPLLPLHSTLIRYWLPIVPIGALLAPEAIRLFARIRWVALGLTVAVAVAFVHAALPDLRALHHRKNVLHAVADWFGENTEPDALIVTQASTNHVRHLAGRETAFVVYDFYDWSHLSGLDAQALPNTMCRVDRALAAGRPVYVSELPAPRLMRWLRVGYRLEPCGKLPGGDIRNRFDVGFNEMGERMRKTADVVLFRLHLRPGMPRFLAPVDVERSDDVVTVRVEHAAAADLDCQVYFAASPATLDPTEPAFYRDAPLRWPGPSGKLDADGRAVFRAPVVDRMKTGRLFVSVMIADSIPRWYTVPTAVPD